DEYNLGSDSDSLSRMFPSTTTGKGRTREHTWDPSTRILKATRRESTGGIFAVPGAATSIPVPQQVPSADPTSPFVLQTAASNAPKDFVAPAFSLGAFLPPRTSSPYKTKPTKPRRTGGLFENEMSFGMGGGEMETENEMFPPIAMSSPDPKRAPKLGCWPCDVSSLLSGPLKKKYRAQDSGAVGDVSIVEEGPELDEGSAEPRTRAQTMSFQRGNLPSVSVNFNFPKYDEELVTPQLGPGNASAWPEPKDADELDLDPEIFNSMVSHTLFSIDGTGAGGSGGGGMPDTPVKKAVFGNTSVGVGGGPIAMGGARGWMTSLPDRGAKAFGGWNAPQPSLPIRFPELSPDSPDESPAAGRSKLPTIDSSNESPTMRPFWIPGGADESPSRRPRRKSGENSSLTRRKSGGGDISLNLGPWTRSTEWMGTRFDPKVLVRGEPGEPAGAEYGWRTGRSAARSIYERQLVLERFFDFLARRGAVYASSEQWEFSSDGEASVNGTPTRRGVGAMRGGLGGVLARPVQPVGARVAQGSSVRLTVPGRSSLPVANWRLVTPSPSLSSLASMDSPLTDTPSAPARKSARASPILSKGKRASVVPMMTFHPPAAAVVEPEPTVTLGRPEREYTAVQEIGKGTFGQVLKVEKAGRLFSVKRSKAFEGVRHR
ncbi:hypothetical protein FRC09_005974, partial [Ceratobasidium sp. 395]